MAFDLPRLQQLMAAFGEPQAQAASYIRDAGLSLDLVDAGIALDVWGAWQLTPPPEPATGR
jgi:hypothetical protein